MKLVVGLGNPGRRYRATPHNVGWDVLDELAVRHGLKWTRARKLEAEFADGDLVGRDCMLLKPTTYMNASGDAVAPLVRGERLEPPRDLMVVLDDVRLPLGRLRVRAQGSPGGHRGLESVCARVGTREIPRLRCGVGPEGEDIPGDVLAEYVLSRWPKDLLREVDSMVSRAADAVEDWLRTNDLEEVMNTYNNRA